MTLSWERKALGIGVAVSVSRAKQPRQIHRWLSSRRRATSSSGYTNRQKMQVSIRVFSQETLDRLCCDGMCLCPTVRGAPADRSLSAPLLVVGRAPRLSGSPIGERSTSGESNAMGAGRAHQRHQSSASRWRSSRLGIGMDVACNSTAGGWPARVGARPAEDTSPHHPIRSRWSARRTAASSRASHLWPAAGGVPGADWESHPAAACCTVDTSQCMSIDAPPFPRHIRGTVVCCKDGARWGWSLSGNGCRLWGNFLQLCQLTVWSAALRDVSTARVAHLAGGARRHDGRVRAMPGSTVQRPTGRLLPGAEPIGGTGGADSSFVENSA
jgi:hypothetical protein